MNNDYIKNFIVESELISMENLREIEDYIFEKNIDFLEALKETGFLNQEILSKIYANIMGVNKIDLSEKIITLDNFKKIPEPISREHNLICFFSDEDNVHIAFSDIASLDILENFFSKKINTKFFLAEHKDIVEKKKKYSDLLSEEILFKNENSVKKISKINDWGIKSEKDLPDNFRNDIANDVYTQNFVVSLLEYAVNNRADFIFFNNSDDDTMISLRIFDRNYDLMKIERGVLFSIILKFKQLSDVNIFEDFDIKQASFAQKIFGQRHNIFLTFVQTDFGQSVTVQLNKNKKFKAELYSFTKKQREIFLSSQRKDSGFLVLSGDNKDSKKKTLYSFLEMDIEKNKEVYMLEEEISYPLDYTKQISVKNAKGILSLLPKIFENFADVLFVEKISRGIIPPIFNYVSTSKKVFVSNDDEVGNFLDNILERNFDKGQMVKNFSSFIEHKDFKKISSENRKKVFLKNDEVKVIKNFLTESEISEIFKKEGLENISKKNISKIEFFTEEIPKKGSMFSVFNKQSDSEKTLILGIVNLGLFLENGFLKRYSSEKIKNSFRKEIKKSILENAVVSAYRGEIDIKELLKYLTK